MKHISVYDLKALPELAHLSYFDLVHPDNDDLVNPFLHALGFNLRKGLSYTTSKHRTMQNTVVVGYVIRGEVRTDREFLTGPFASLDDRVAAAALTDMSLCAELCYKMGTLSSISAYESNRSDDGPDPDFPEALTEADEQDVLAEIRLLERVLSEIRGSQHNEDGSLKRPEDYRPKEATNERPKGRIRTKLALVKEVIS